MKNDKREIFDDIADQQKLIHGIMRTYHELGFKKGFKEGFELGKKTKEEELKEQEQILAEENCDYESRNRIIED